MDVLFIDVCVVLVWCCVCVQRQLPAVNDAEDEPSEVDGYEHDDDAGASEARMRDRVARLIDDGASVDGDASDDEEDPAACRCLRGRRRQSGW